MELMQQLDAPRTAIYCNYRFLKERIQLGISVAQDVNNRYINRCLTMLRQLLHPEQNHKIGAVPKKNICPACAYN